MAALASRWTKSRIAIAAVAVVLLWLASPWGVCHQEHLSVCRCGSMGGEERWRLFSHEGPRIPFLPDDADVRPTKALAEVFGPEHEHDWGRLHGVVGAGLWSSHYSGSAGIPRIARRHYETDAGLRAALGKALREGRTTREEAASLLALGWFGYGSRHVVTGDAQAAIARKGLAVLSGSEFESRGEVLEYLNRLVR